MSDPTYIAGHLRQGGHSPGGVRDSADVRVEQHRLPTTYLAFAELPDAPGEMVAGVLQTLARYGHAIDTGDPALLALVFADGAAAEETGDAVDPPPSHHLVNTEVKRHGEEAVAWSRLVTIAGDGSAASADVLDVLTAQGGGWRVTRRVLHPRHGGAARVRDGDLPWR